MCGIAGFLNFDGVQADTKLLKHMTDSIAHRGPDDEGLFFDGPLGLGHRRLAIIDLSPSGHQPMKNEDGSIWITYNGEIYNFNEIRRILESHGHHFCSSSDTEVIVHAYEEWGFECLKWFNGMFSFGLWDSRVQHLWLVRDRLGIKPLFYSIQPNKILFGSEIKAILCDKDINRTLDYEALSYYLALNYTPAPFTMFKDIRQLLPGHYLVARPDGRTNTVEYWDVVYDEDRKRSEASYVEEFNTLLEDSVRLRLVSDVPFGAFLSGGVDSSAITYIMSRLLPEPVKTFSIGFSEPSFDELEPARVVANLTGSDHHERIITADAAGILPELVWHAEEPTADSSMIAVYYMAQTAREHVKMVLSGDGADEILAGYETYQAFYLNRLYRMFMPSYLHRSVISPLIRSLPDSDSKVSLTTKLKRFIGGADYPPEDAHGLWRIIFDESNRHSLLAPIMHYPGVKADVLDLYRAVFSKTNAVNPLNRLLYVDTRFYLPNDMLVKVDRMTMAHGLEARVPYLDYRLVEFAATVPVDLKLRSWLKKKYLLKTSMRGKLPKSILERKKEGFNIPNAHWIRGKMKPFVMDSLSPGAIREIGIFEENFVYKILDDHMRNKSDNSHQIWNLLTFVIWWNHFMKRSAL